MSYNPQNPNGQALMANSSPVVIASDQSPIPVSNGITDNNWVTIESYVIDTNTAAYNSRPAPGDFVTVPQIVPTTQQIEVLAKIKTSPSSLYKLFVWINDGTEIYCISPSFNDSTENSISVQDTNGTYDGVVPVLIDLKRYTPTIKVAVNVIVEGASVISDVDGNCYNPSFKGGEQVLLNTTGLLPQGIAANATNFNAVTDTFSYIGASFADGELLRINNNSIFANAMPPLGIAACFDSKDIVIDSDEIVLDGRVPNPFVVGDIVRLRAYGLSTLPTTNVGAFQAGANYIVSYSVGNVIKLSGDGVQSYILTAPGIGKLYIFKFPFEDVYMKGTNQLSKTFGGPAIDFINEYNNTPITVNPGQAAQITYPTGTFVARQVLNSYVFTVSAIGTAISAGAVYRVTVGSINYDFTFGNGAALNATLLRSTVATGAPPATGTLTLQSGTGPATIAYTAATFGLISTSTLSGVVWADTLNLFVAVSTSGTGNRVLTSPDGITWTARQSAADNTWNAIAWNGTILVAVSSTGTGTRCMTSTDGITWTIRTTPADNSWASVVWSPTLNLFCAVATTGVGNRIMTSPDGINWTARQSPADLSWTGVTWAGGTTNLFVAVALTGNDNRITTSPDGINWTLRNVSTNTGFRSVTWSSTLNLLVAVGDGGGIQTSPNGINWTLRTTPTTFNYTNVIWVASLGLFFACSTTGTLIRVSTSPDGINWTARTTPADQSWSAMAFSTTLNRLVVVSVAGTTNTVMTSDSASWIPHGYLAGKELSMQATTIPGGAIQTQKFFVASNPAPTTYAYSLSLTPGGPAVAFTSVGAGVFMVDPLNPFVLIPVTVIAGAGASFVFANNYVLGANLSEITLGGTSLPGGYVAGTILYPLSPTNAGTQLASTNKSTPIVFNNAGTGVTLSSNGYVANIVIEKTTAFIAQTPTPTNNLIKLANTALGPALSLEGGVGNFEIIDASGTQIKATSYVKARAI